MKRFGMVDEGRKKSKKVGFSQIYWNIFHKVPQIKVSIYDLDRLYILKGTVHSTNDKFLSVFASKNLMQPTILEKLPNTQCRLVFFFSYCNWPPPLYLSFFVDFLFITNFVVFEWFLLKSQLNKCILSQNALLQWVFTICK